MGSLPTPLEEAEEEEEQEQEEQEEEEEEEEQTKADRQAGGPAADHTSWREIKPRSAVTHFMGGVITAGGGGGGANGGGGGGGDHHHHHHPDLPLRFPYMRPEFLALSPDEVECSADHGARPILILRESRRLPWSTGYAEYALFYVRSVR
ncbi:hypothetical protein CRUP_028911 [Coryphaenoides rupestris]|nr:hypothetical protein CRUP_028911 [Coryphaenoides rupestris]